MSRDDLRVGLSPLPIRMRDLLCGLLKRSLRKRDAFVSAFDDIERTDIEPASHLISRADYLNASARPEAARVRIFVDQLLDQYPAAKRDDLVRRIRSRDDSHHRSACFELLLHGLLVARDFTVVEVEPPLPGGRSPDFLVAAPDGREFFLEATVAEGEIGADPGADRRMRDVLQAIDQVESPDFFLNLHHRGAPAQPVRCRHLRTQVQRFVNGLDYESAVADFAEQRPGQVFNFEEHGLTLRITVVPKHLRQASGRAIGGRILPGGVVQPHLPIKAAVESKASRYGQLDRPYIIAVCALETFANADSAIDALFGTEAVIVTENGDHRLVRNCDGAWRGSKGPIHTRVSAVLSAERLTPWDVGQRQMRLIHNPWAARPLSNLPLGVEVCEVVEDRLKKVPGLSLAEIFGLSSHWPE
ncbi:hypothetical protein [Acidiphilium iwatense]|uniref:Uncharacterized protein n=1 Tax=Acidiphilium iwatense TaxID=768198 RepID=A0ABS9DW38_9PROT|nr:hypothetical protein [Acidiphilium iwatense]MCF3946954.1 hypothetical protein [Acidiphilium iwatense]